MSDDTKKKTKVVEVDCGNEEGAVVKGERVGCDGLLTRPVLQDVAY